MRDATYDPNVHLTLGRGSDCDLQILHDGVSRHHACITTDDFGRHVLVDLESTNGTVVDTKPVKRLVLEVGTVFEIMRYRFVYEEEVKLAPVEFDPAAPREAGAPISRTTIEYKAFAAEQSKTPEPELKTDPRRDTLYDGDIIGDIAEYRSLRTRILRGVPLSAPQEAAFHHLEGRMRPSGRAATAAGSTSWYRRFTCNIAASLRLFTGDELPATLTNIGVDGATVSVGTHTTTPDTLVWLAVERKIDGIVRTLVFPGRAAWVRSNVMGMSFSGSPGWSLRDPREAEATCQEMDPYCPEENTAVLHLDDRPQIEPEILM